jgi:tRNA nucleotidyltransferase (CCA-adding enzyme)
MSKVLSLPPELDDLLQAITAGVEIGLYVVGGFVRDLLLGKPNTDLDIVVEGDAIAFTEGLVQRYGGEKKAHDKFRTARWTFEPGRFSITASFVDFTSARTETYETPGALPIVKTPASIEQDMARRDFTINAMAIRLAPSPVGLLIDPHGGEEDLRRKLIHVLHDKSFKDDGHGFSVPCVSSSGLASKSNRRQRR